MGKFVIFKNIVYFSTFGVEIRAKQENISILLKIFVQEKICQCIIFKIVLETHKICQFEQQSILLENYSSFRMEINFLTILRYFSKPRCVQLKSWSRYFWHSSLSHVKLHHNFVLFNTISAGTWCVLELIHLLIWLRNQGNIRFSWTYCWIWCCSGRKSTARLFIQLVQERFSKVLTGTKHV